MTQSLHFSASTSVKNLFGRGLVTDQVAAVFELDVYLPPIPVHKAMFLVPLLQQ